MRNQNKKIICDQNLRNFYKNRWTKLKS